MRIGIFSKTFPAPDVDACFARVAAAGYRAVQFNFASAGLDPLPPTVPDDTVAAVAAAQKRRRMEIAAVSATFNMIHPDEQMIVSGLAGLEALACRAAALDCHLLTLCTGTLDPDDQWRAHPGNGSPQAWDALTAAMERALAIAERYEVNLGIEPEFANVVSSAAKARALIDQMKSPRLKVIFDAANLFEIATPDEQRRAVSAALDLLAGDIAIAHAKDRDAGGAFATAGAGVLDYRHYLGELRRIGFNGCLVTHGLKAGEADGVAAMLTREMQLLKKINN